MKTLWLVGGGRESVPGVECAKRMGLHVVVSDGDPNAPAMRAADVSIVASTYDVDATLAAARDYHAQYGLHGITCVGADVPLTVATVAQGLGLPGISIAAAKLVSHKLAMKQRFEACGIPTARFQQVRSVHELENAVAAVDYSVILKPVDSRGARGVICIDEDTDLGWAFELSSQYSSDGSALVEEYLSGPQVSTESVLLPGGAATPGFCDRNYELLERYKPFVIENGGHQPSVLSKSERVAITRLAERAGRALGIDSGIAKGDMVLTSDGPKVIEIAGRLSGGWFSTDQIPLATGVDLVGAAIKLALGETVRPEDVTPQYWRGVAIRYFFPPAGRIREIRGADEVAARPWVHRLVWFASVGDVVQAVANHTQRVGCVITVGETRDQAVYRATQAVDDIDIVTEAA